jgi:hypothetical protein
MSFGSSQQSRIKAVHMAIKAQLSAPEPYALAIMAKHLCAQLREGGGGNLIGNDWNGVQLKALIGAGSCLEQASRDAGNV